jgi:hypothetical protein
MPLIRKAATEYKDVWNLHHIRPQSHRPNHQAGQPKNLYFYPPHGVKRYGGSIDPEKLGRIRADFEGFGNILLPNQLVIITNLFRYGQISTRRYIYVVL